MFSRNQFLVSAIAFVCSVVSPHSQNCSGQDETNLVILRSTSGVMEDNYARFPYGTIRFRYQTGFTKDAGKARAGVFETLAEARGLLIFDRQHARLEHIFPQDVLARERHWTSAMQSTTWLQSFRCVTNNKQTIFENQPVWRDGTPRSGVTLESGVQALLSCLAFPLDLGAPQDKHGGTAGNAKLALQRHHEVKLTGVDADATWDGVRVVRLSFAYLKFLQEGSVDLERGGIPVYSRVQVVGTDFGNEDFCEEIRQVSGHGWLPYLWTSRSSQGRTRRVVVEATDFDHPPKPQDFTLTFAEPTSLVDPQTQRRFVGDHLVWNLDQLPALAPPEDQTPRGPQPQQPLPVLPGEIEGRSYPFTTMALVGLAVFSLVLGGRAALKRRSSRHLRS